MSCPFANGEHIPATLVKPILRPDPIIGTRISFYDQEFIWTAEHRTPTELKEWRKHGDTIIDCFFQLYGDKFQDGDDTYEFLHRLVDDEQCSISSITEFSQTIRERPSWFNREQVERGQHFYLTHSALALVSIFHYTLLLGYGFQQLNDVLLKTQYLSSSDLFQTFRRLVETFSNDCHSDVW